MRTGMTVRAAAPRDKTGAALETRCVRIEQAGADDVEPLARLLWLDTNGDEPDRRELDGFAEDLRAWWRSRASSFAAFLARNDGAGGQPVGMAWVALPDRVPRPNELHRFTGDIQSVYVLPQHRGYGLGSVLVEAASRYAETLGAARVTVSSGRRAVPIYERLGFASSSQLLQRP